MASPEKSANIKRVIAEAVVGALLILSFPATLLFTTQALHGGQHGASHALGMAVLSVLGILLLADAWRLMRQQEAVTPRAADRTGGGTQMPR